MADRWPPEGFYRWVIMVLWLLLLVGVPITSFPPLAEAIGGVTVSPFSLLPLLILIPVFLVPDLLRGGRLPMVIWPLLGFVLAALLSAGVALFLPLIPFKGEDILGRVIHAGATLAVGLAFYLVASRLPSTDGRWKITLWGLYVGGLLALIWATVQADYILEGLNNVPGDLNQFHRLISIRDLERNRVTGLAFEPSWFGDQLVVLYIPLWAGAVLNGRSLLRWHRGPISLELGLCLWSGWLLLMTRSRVSVAALLLALGIGLVVVFWRLSGWFLAKVSSRGSWLATRSASWLLRTALLLVAIAIVLGTGYLAIRRGAQVDWRMRRVLSLSRELPSIQQEYPFSAEYEIANRFAFAERLVYWRASMQGFTLNPLTGVGLGNAGFIFEQGVPSYGYNLVEIQAFMDPGQPNFPNPKNLWIRLLSEGGIMGFSFYITWLIMLGAIALKALRSEPEYRWLATTLVISLIMQLVEGFSLDSFALPQIWLLNGIATSRLLLKRPQSSGK
jgi:O-antigen ligase